MSDIRPAFRSYLLGDSNLVALIGDRIQPGLAQQGTAYPVVTYQRISGIGDHHMQGPSGLVRQRYQFNVWAKDPDTANTISDIIKDLLDGYRGDMGDVSDSLNVLVQGVFLTDESEGYEQATELYLNRRDYWFVYEY